MPKTLRINKFLRDCRLGSRRKCETLIEQGKVTVNGRVVEDLGTMVDPGFDEVRVEGEIVDPVEERIYIAAYKPRGVIVTASDPHGRKTVFDGFTGLPAGLFSVGRLDMDSEGLLLLTNDGKLGFRLSHPRYEIERVYRVGVRGDMGDNRIKDLRKGVRLEEGEVRPRRVRVAGRDADTTFLEITLCEGKKREIRRMVAACGFEVDRLKRIRFGPVGLGDLRPGEWRHMTRDEVRGLRREVEQAYLSKRKH
jgi:23S rRNA pseudouridine2605 synthase